MSDKFISLHRHPQAAKQKDLIQKLEAKGVSKAAIWEILDACAEDQREAVKAQHAEVSSNLETFNTVRGRGRHRQIKQQQVAPVAKEKRTQRASTQAEEFDPAAFQVDALEAAKAFGAEHGRKAAQ